MPSENHRLAAILFADIQGYTALMQTHEQQALAALDKFKKTLENLVPQHQGELIQFYGDGCLATFHSSIDAVTCAKELQLVFQSDPIVPVRIGLHAGDVVFKDGNVFGDAINIASRVESMGVPGSVLLSGNVRNQIKNKPEFELVGLGEFEFKNVVEGMMVYALKEQYLIIPNREDIKGKIKSTSKKIDFRKSFLLIAFGLFALLSIVLWKNKKEKSSVLPDKIRDERVAVLPFKNSTGIKHLRIEI